MDEKGSSLDVTEELVAEPLALARALDETRDVGDHERGVLTRTDDAQVGDERGEGVVGDLWLGGADPGDERALSDRGHAHKGNVGHELHLELDPVLSGRLALLGKRRRATGGGHEVDVSATAQATRGHDDLLAGLCEVGDLEGGGHRLGVKLANDGAKRDAQDEVLAVATMLAGTLPVRSALSAEVVLEAVVDKRRELRVDTNDDVSAIAAVTPVRSALGDICLSTERHAAGTAVATADVDPGKVCEHRAS